MHKPKSVWVRQLTDPPLRFRWSRWRPCVFELRGREKQRPDGKGRIVLLSCFGTVPCTFDTPPAVDT